MLPKKRDRGEEEPRRRSSYIDHEVVYVAVGASAASDLLRFPPEGTSPFAFEMRIGSGAERFLAASSTLMTWGAHRASGALVEQADQREQQHYQGVLFGEDGTPEATLDADVNYGPDGEPFLTAGVTASITTAGASRARRVRVVYTVDESRSSGFALGTADSNGVIGETAFVVEHREDDTVWACARGFHSAPEDAAGLFGLKAKAALRQAEKEAEHVLTGLLPGAAKASEPEKPAGPEATDAHTSAETSASPNSEAAPLTLDETSNEDVYEFAGTPVSEVVADPATEPGLASEPAAESESESEPVPSAPEPEPVPSAPEPETAVVPEMAPEPEMAAEPVPTPEPESALESDSSSEPELELQEAEAESPAAPEPVLEEAEAAPEQLHDEPEPQAVGVSETPPVALETKPILVQNAFNKNAKKRSKKRKGR